MALFLTTLAEPSQDHRVEPLTEGFLILPVPGREQQFDRLARRVLDHAGPFAAFARKSEEGVHEAVHILPDQS